MTIIKAAIILTTSKLAVAGAQYTRLVTEQARAISLVEFYYKHMNYKMKYVPFPTF